MRLTQRRAVSAVTKGCVAVGLKFYATLQTAAAAAEVCGAEK